MLDCDPQGAGSNPGEVTFLFLILNLSSVINGFLNENDSRYHKPPRGVVVTIVDSGSLRISGSIPGEVENCNGSHGLSVWLSSNVRGGGAALGWK